MFVLHDNFYSPICSFCWNCLNYCWFLIIKHLSPYPFAGNEFSECTLASCNISYFLKWISSFLFLQTYQHKNNTSFLNSKRSSDSYRRILFIAHWSTNPQILTWMYTFSLCSLFSTPTKMEHTTIKICWYSWMKPIWIYCWSYRYRVSITMSISYKLWTTKRSLHWNYCPYRSNRWFYPHTTLSELWISWWRPFYPSSSTLVGSATWFIYWEANCPENTMRYASISYSCGNYGTIICNGMAKLVRNIEFLTISKGKIQWSYVFISTKRFTSSHSSHWGLFSGVVTSIITNLEKSSQISESFLFSFLSFYGTSITVVPATTQDLDAIIKIRSGVVNLKKLTPLYIQQHIQEFVLAILSDETTRTPVGIMRIFTPPAAPHVLEMGSFVKVKPEIVSWVSTILIKYAEFQAMLEQKKIIAITDKIQNQIHTCLALCLGRQGWTDKVSISEYSERLAESPGKELWEKIPKRLDPDSKIFMYP